MSAVVHHSCDGAMGQEFARLPADTGQELLEQMTSQALGVEYGVQCLEAPSLRAATRKQKVEASQSGADR
jgi:hypothetical protein